MRSEIIVLILVACALTACIPTEFDTQREQAQTIGLEPPADFAISTFGRVVVGYGGTLTGENASRIAATAGEGSPFTVYPLLIGDEVRLDTPTMDGCDADIPCARGAGVSLIGVPSYAGREMCLMAPSPETGEVKIRCEDNLTMSPPSVMGPGGARFGESGAPIEAGHAWGVAIFGAPGSGADAGSVYRLASSGPVAPLDLSEGMGTGVRLGQSVAVGTVDASTVLIAATTTDRVILATSTLEMDGTVTTRSRGCVDGTTMGFGQSLAIGDFDGDGAPDVAIASGTGMGRTETISIYAGSAMPVEGSCAGAWPAATVLSCPDSEGVTCADSDFGTALAVGDVNADGLDDLIVGAPGAEVDGTVRAGAVYVFLGAASIASLDVDSVALTHSSPERDAGLGSAVASSPGQTSGGITRDEVVAGSPGTGRVYVFLCTGLDTDTPMSQPGSRCQPLDT